MPRVKVYESQVDKQDFRRGGAVDTRAMGNENAMSSKVGATSLLARNMNKFANASQEWGDVASKVALNRRDTAEMNEIRDLITQDNTEADQREMDYAKNRQGSLVKDANGDMVYDNESQWLEEKLQSRLNSLNNDRKKEIYKKLYEGFRSSHLSKAKAFTQQQNDVWHMESVESHTRGMISSGVQQAQVGDGKNLDNTLESIRLNMQDINNDATEFRIHETDFKKLDSPAGRAFAEQRSNIYLQAYKNIMATDPGAAKTFYDQNRQYILPENRDGIEAQLNTASKNDKINSMVAQALDPPEGKTPEDIINTINDKDIRDGVRFELKQRKSQDEMVRKEELKRQKTQAFQSLIKMKSQGMTYAEYRKHLTSEFTDPEVFDAMDSYAKKVYDPNFNDDFKAYNNLRSMDLEEFSKVDLTDKKFMMRLKPATLVKLADEQQRVRSAIAKSNDEESRKQLTKWKGARSQLQMAKDVYKTIDEKGTNPQLQKKFFDEFDRRIEEIKESGPVSVEDVQKTLGNMMLRNDRLFRRDTYNFEDLEEWEPDRPEGLPKTAVWNDALNSFVEMDEKGAVAKIFEIRED